MTKEHKSLLKSLTIEQIVVCQDIMKVVDSQEGKSYFLYGYGGTGETFTWMTFSTTIRSKGTIVLNVTSSGIASLLLRGKKNCTFNILYSIINK